MNVRIGPRLFQAFHVWGVAALTLAAVIGFVLGIHLGFSFWAVTPGIVLALFTFYATALVTKVLTGEEGLTFYHQLIGVTSVLVVAAWLLGQPVLLVADLAMISVGATLSFGRIGCLMVGCCHGRPCRVGVRYSAEHAAAGFTAELVGVRLFPVQIIEFLFAVGTTPIGCLMIWNGSIPGAAAAWYVATYCSARYCFEFARWPANYQFKSGLSQYQWISVVLVLFLVSLELGGVVPFQFWHVVMAAGLLLVTAVVVLERRLRSFEKALNHPDHIRELAHAIDEVSWRAENPATSQDPFGDLPIATTSLGLQITASRISSATGDVYHYALYSRRKELTDEIMNSLAKLIGGSNRLSTRKELIKGCHGVFHLLILPTTG